jgi:peptide/nickel transport system substrate-binding protein
MLHSGPTIAFLNRRVSRRGGIRGGLLGAAALTGGYALACGGDSKQSGADSGSRATSGPQSKAAEAPRSGGVISQRFQQEPNSLDLHQVTTYQGVWPTAPCFNQLVQYDPDKPGDLPQEIIADLAEQWEQPDSTTLVFSLRKGVKFHDGSDFGADDAKVQFEWIKKPPQGKSSIRAPRMAVIDAMESPDPSTFRLKLTRPSPSMLGNLASHFFTVGQGKDILANGEISPKLIGTGPFKLKSFQRGNLIELEKNPAYHLQGYPYLDGLRFYFLPDLATAIANFIGGQYQLFFDPGFLPSDVQRVKDEVGDKVVADSVLSTIRDPVYTNARRKPYDDIRVRRAISLVLDRDVAIKVVKQGSAARGGIMVPKGVWAISEAELRAFDGYDKPNVERAKQLLTEAGVATPLEATATPRPDAKDSAEFAKDALAKIGINLKVAIGDIATTQPQMQRGDFDISPWLVGVDTDDPDAAFSEVATSSAVRNWSAVKDAQIDALYDKQSQTIDFNDRKKLVQELEKQALSQYQASYLYFQQLNYARYASVQNLTLRASLYTNRRMERVWLKQ